MSQGRQGGTRRGPDPPKASLGSTAGAGTVSVGKVWGRAEAVAGVDLTADSSLGLWRWQALGQWPLKSWQV